MKVRLIFLFFLFFVLISVSCSVVGQQSGSQAVSVFAFKARHNPQLDNDVFADIDYVARTIHILVPGNVDLSSLVAYFSSASEDVVVKVDGVVQQSGITPNDFTKPLTYEVFGKNGDVLRYVVTVSQDVRSYNANLSLLTNAGGHLFPRFHPSTNHYTFYEIGGGSFSISLTSEDPHSTWKILPFYFTNVQQIDIPVTNEEFQILIRVLAEDGISERDYTVDVVPLPYFRSLKVSNTMLLLTNDAVGRKFLTYCKSNHITHLVTEASFYGLITENSNLLTQAFLNGVSLDLFDYGVLEVSFPLADSGSNSWTNVDHLLTNSFPGVEISYLLPPPVTSNQITNWLDSYFFWNDRITNTRFIPILSPDIVFLSNLSSIWSNAPMRFGFSASQDSYETLNLLFQASEIWKEYGWVSETKLIWLSAPLDLNFDQTSSWVNSVSKQLLIWHENFPSLKIEGMFLGNAPSLSNL